MQNPDNRHIISPHHPKEMYERRNQEILFLGGGGGGAEIFSWGAKSSIPLKNSGSGT